MRLPKTISATAAAVLLALATACGVASDDATDRDTDPDPGAVSRADYGDDWPLTVDSGTLACDNQAVTFTTDDGTPYAVNGMAETRGHTAIDPIWADNPEATGGPKMNIGPLIDAGLALC